MKRKNGTASSPITFSSIFALELRELRRGGVNVSEWIDTAIRLVLEHGNVWGEHEGLGADPTAIRAAAELRIVETLNGDDINVYACRRAWAQGHKYGYVVIHPQRGIHPSVGSEDE